MPWQRTVSVSPAGRRNRCQSTRSACQNFHPVSVILLLLFFSGFPWKTAVPPPRPENQNIPSLGARLLSPEPGRRPCAPACTVPAGRSPPAAWSPTAPHPPSRGTGSGGAVRRGRGGGRLLCHRRHEEAAEPRASRSGGCPPHLVLFPLAQREPK